MIFFLPGNLGNCSTLLLHQKSDGRFLCLQVCICCSPWQRRWVTPSRSLLSYGALMTKAWSQTPAHYGLFCLPRRNVYIFSLTLARLIRTPVTCSNDNGHFSLTQVKHSHTYRLQSILCALPPLPRSPNSISLVTYDLNIPAMQVNSETQEPRLTIGPLSDKILAY